MKKPAQAVCGHDGANSFMHGASKAPLRLHLCLDRVKWMTHDCVCSAKQRARARCDGVFANGLASSPFGRRHARRRGYCCHSTTVDTASDRVHVWMLGFRVLSFRQFAGWANLG